jgi:predicted Zn finger-like uncharacterized protein
MRIECDNCSARYSIADEKVVGKLYRVKCKKCGHMIMVDGTHLVADEAEEATRVFDMNAAASEAQASLDQDAPVDAVWYVVLDGAEAGPLDANEVSEQLHAGAIDADTLVWCEGMADWAPLSTVDAFADLMLPSGAHDDDGGFEDEATRVVDTSSEERTFNFGGLSASASPAAAFPSGGFTAAPAPTPSAPEPVSFDAPSPRPTATSGASVASFSGPPAGAAPQPAGSGGGLGQRNESSVLFSLSELTANAGDRSAKDELPRTEASGLIDIRVLSSTMAMPAQPSAPSSVGGPAAGGIVAGGASAMPMAPLIAVQPRKTSPVLIAALVIGGCAIIALLVTLVVILSKDEAPIDIAASSAPSAGAVAALDPGASAAGGEGDGATPAAPEPATAEPAEGDGAADVEAAADAAAAEGAGGAEVEGATADGDAEAVADAEQTPATTDDDTDAVERRAAATREAERTRTAAREPAAPSPPTTTAAAPTPSREAERESSRSGSRSASDAPAAPTTARSERTAPTAADRDRPRGDDAVNSALSAIRRDRPDDAPAERPTRPSEGRTASRSSDAAPAAASAGLSRSQVQSTIRQYQRQFTSCRTRDDQAGTYRIRFIVQPSGSVTNAQSEDRGDVGRCLVNVARDMSFPSFSGDPQPVPWYPIQL